MYTCAHIHIGHVAGYELRRSLAGHVTLFLDCLAQGRSSSIGIQAFISPFIQPLFHTSSSLGQLGWIASWEQIFWAVTYPSVPSIETILGLRFGRYCRSTSGFRLLNIIGSFGISSASSGTTILIASILPRAIQSCSSTLAPLCTPRSTATTTSNGRTRAGVQIGDNGSFPVNGRDDDPRGSLSQ